MNKPSHAVKSMTVDSRKVLPSTSGSNNLASADILKKQVELLKARLDRRNIKVSKAAES